MPPMAEGDESAEERGGVDSEAAVADEDDAAVEVFRGVGWRVRVGWRCECSLGGDGLRRGARARATGNRAPRDLREGVGQRAALPVGVVTCGGPTGDV